MAFIQLWSIRPKCPTTLWQVSLLRLTLLDNTGNFFLTDWTFWNHGGTSNDERSHLSSMGDKILAGGNMNFMIHEEWIVRSCDRSKSDRVTDARLNERKQTPVEARRVGNSRFRRCYICIGHGIRCLQVSVVT
ncbi:hypothetical protein BJV78DRAFT_1237132 [Lactifluus subvellereus]|nr:hypothetical protein BJV78DRAFT_1237132 [Lactifluus subvellereus]